jgi:zinc protease
MHTLLAAPDRRMLETFWNKPVHRTVLPNGATAIVLADDSAPVASVQVWVKTGSIHEGPLLGSGVSHFLEHMLFKGTARRAGRAISAEVQACGGNLNAYTTFDRTVYYADLPAAHVATGLDVLADMVLHSTLPENEFARERDVILREIAMMRDDMDGRLGEALFDTAFREHPRRYPIIGYKDVFTTLTRDDLLAYYRGRYVANNLVVVVCGDVEPAATLALVEKHFGAGAAPRGRLLPAPVAGEPAQLAPRSLDLFEEVELTRAGLAWHVPGLTHPDSPVLDLLAMILGHGDSSLLWQSLREKKRLVHTIDASNWAPGDTGLFSIFFTCDRENRATATAAVHAELRRALTTGLTVERLRKAIRQVVVSEINSRKTMSGQAARLGAAEVIAGDLHFSRAWFDRIARVTTADLRRVLKAWLPAGTETAVSLNPRASVPAAAPAILTRAAPALPAPVTLANGARLLLLPNRRLPNLHLRLLCEGGPLHEPANRRGLTSLLATLLTRDTEKRDAAEVARAIEEIGGALYPFSGNNCFGLAAEVLPADSPRALELLADAIYRPAFARATFDTERDARIADLQQDADDVVTVGRKLLRRHFFGNYPLAINANGEAAHLRDATPADARKLWDALRVGANTVLVAAGDFDPAKLAPRLETLLGKLPRGTPPQRPAPFTTPPRPGNYTEHQPREQAVVFDAFAGPALTDADYTTGEVADELFSGMSSRLFERVREEKGLAYFVRAQRITGVEAGLFGLYAGTAPGKEDDVLAEFDAEIARVKAGKLAAEELERCRTRLKAGRRMSQQTNASRAMQHGINHLFGLPSERFEDYDRKIDDVSKDQLRDFARRRFGQKQRVRLVVRP